MSEPEPDVGALLRLDGKVVLLTGASSGLGARFARVLDASGAVTVLVARRRDRLDALATGLDRAHVLAADLADPAAAAGVVDAVIAGHGRLDVLVNNAGAANVTAAVNEDLDDFARVLDLNLVAPFALARAAARHWRETGTGGVVVNVASIIASVASPLLPEASYSASKGGLVSLTRELAVQWTRYGIRVNALAPGWFPSEMTEGITADPERTATFESRIPLGRLGAPHELDAALLFLASDASSYVTGQVLVVDGGATAI